jgi:hypothetical protein
MMTPEEEARIKQLEARFAQLEKWQTFVSKSIDALPREFQLIKGRFIEINEELGKLNKHVTDLEDKPRSPADF